MRNITLKKKFFATLLVCGIILALLLPNFGFPFLIALAAVSLIVTLGWLIFKKAEDKSSSILWRFALYGFLTRSVLWNFSLLFKGKVPCIPSNHDIGAERISDEICGIIMLFGLTSVTAHGWIEITKEIKRKRYFERVSRLLGHKVDN